MIVPGTVLHILRQLHSHGWEAYLVGGSIRDILLARQPKDWDVATSATPAEVKAIFPDHTPTGERFGTVTVHLPCGDGEVLSVEVTTFRAEGEYQDGRHPAQVEFGCDLTADLARRDFTINAMAWNPERGLVDPFGGSVDLRAGRIRSVGDPLSRFGEDGLRMLRAARLASQLDFRVALDAKVAMRACARIILHQAPERIQAELALMLTGQNPVYALRILRVTGLLGLLLPEVAAGYAFAQSEHHAYSVYTHGLLALRLSPPRLAIRLAALLHDIGKTTTRTVGPDGVVSFRYHDEAGARLAHEALSRLRFPGHVVDDVVRLIRFHMFHWDPRAGREPLRRLIARVGVDHIRDLVDLRRVDLLAIRPLRPKGDARLEFLSTLETTLDEILAQGGAFTLKDLAINGHDLTTLLAVRPGPLVGQVLRHLFDVVLADPTRNDRETLLSLAETYLSERA